MENAIVFGTLDNPVGFGKKRPMLIPGRDAVLYILLAVAAWCALHIMGVW